MKPHQFDHIEVVDKIVALARSFPALSEAPIWPDATCSWNPNALDRWANHQLGDNDLPVRVRNSRASAAAFVLMVWDWTVNWYVNRFNLVLALSSWDEADKNAFCAWLSEPWSR